MKKGILHAFTSTILFYLHNRIISKDLLKFLSEICQFLQAEVYSCTQIMKTSMATIKEEVKS